MKLFDADGREVLSNPPPPPEDVGGIVHGKGTWAFFLPFVIFIVGALIVWATR